MYPVAWDTETALIRPGLCAPPLACLTWQRRGFDAQITDGSEARSRIVGWLNDADTLLVGHNVAYDLGVVCAQWPELIPSVFAAYRADRVTDTMLRQQLLDIAAGVYRGRPGERGKWIVHEYSLDALAKRCAGMQLQKDAWRLSYGEFLTTPLRDWPKRAVEVQAAAKIRLGELVANYREASDVEDDSYEAELAKAQRAEIEGLRSMIASDPEQCIKYPLDDARATLAVFETQEAHASYLADQFRQARAAWWLHLSSAWGLRTDAVGVEALRQSTADALAELKVSLKEEGLVKPDGVCDTKAAKARMIEICRRDRHTLRRTDAHMKENKCKRLDGTAVPDGDESCEVHVSLDADACASSEDDILMDYSELSTLKKVLSNDCVALAKGGTHPIHTRYGLAETGRTTSAKPNIQNLRVKVGIREAFIPRPGHVFVACDYPQLELYTLAQCCVTWLGQSRLAEALNCGLDPHLALAAQIVGVDYAEAKRRHESGDVGIKDARDLAKKINFGLPGGMGLTKFERLVRLAFKPEVIERLGINQARLKEFKEQWFATWPELRGYFARVNGLCNEDTGRAFIETLWTKRYRGGASYCAACNNGFQALGVDCAKEAGWRIAQAQYTWGGAHGGLWNTRTVAFVHDEFVLECLDDERAPDAAHALADAMHAGANLYLPNVPIPRAKLEPFLMRRWSKKAKPVHDANGRLIPWIAPDPA